MGPSYYPAQNGTIAGYGNPSPAAQPDLSKFTGGSQPLSNSQTVVNPAAGTVLGDNTPPPDPNQLAAQQAAAATAAANASKTAAFNTQNDQAVAAAGGAGDASARGYGSSILDFLTATKQGQNTIDQEGVQSELAKRQGNQGVLDYVNHGIQSGGVLLGNKNAGTSSATEALARAYSMLGAHQMAGVGTQYAQDQNKIGTEQTNLNIGIDEQRRHNEDYKTNAVAGVVSNAQQQIANIISNMQYANLPSQINMQQEIEQIKAETAAKLSAVDPTFDNGDATHTGIANLHPTDIITRAGQAQNLANAGTAADNPYQLTTQAPAAFAGGGQPAGSDLPIYTIPRSKVAA